MNAIAPSEQFHAERLTGLGASDVAAVLGYNPYRTGVDVYLEKTGAMPPDESSMRLRFGQYNEEFVAREYTAVTGLSVQRYNPMLRHAEFPCVLGHVDRLVIPPGKKVAAHRREIRTDRGLEAKTVDAFVYRTSGEWGEPGTDEVPLYYLIQCAIYLALTGCATWDVAAMIGSGSVPLAIYTLRRDLDLENELLRRAHEWWHAHVVAGVPPEPVNESDVALLYPQAAQKPKPVIATDEILQHVAGLRSCKRAFADLKRLEAEHAMAVKRFMGHADVLVTAGEDGRPEKLVTWGNRKGRIAFDLDVFVARLCPGATPDERRMFIEDAKRTYTNRGAPGRTFIVK